MQTTFAIALTGLFRVISTAAFDVELPSTVENGVRIPDGSRSFDGFSRFEFWTQAIISAAAAGFAGVAAWMAIRASRQTQEAMRTSSLQQKKLATLQQLTSVRQQYRDLDREIGSLDGELPEEGSEQFKKILVLLGLYEHIASAVNAGVLDLELLDRMSGGYMRGRYVFYARFIRWRRRKRHPRFFDQFDLLISRLNQLHTARYQILKPTLLDYRKRYFYQRRVKKLEPLIGLGPFTRQELNSALVDVGLMDENHGISFVSRLRPYKVEPYAPEDRDAAVDCLLAVQDATRGLWPVGVASGDRGAMTAWFERRASSNHMSAVVRDGNRVLGIVGLEDLARRENCDYWIDAFGQIQQRNRTKDFDTLSINLDLNDLQVRNRTAVVTSLAVDPELRRFGIGRLLLRYAIEFGQIRLSTEPKKVFLAVIPTLEEAIRLYESEGGELLGTYTGQTHEMHLYAF